MSDMYQPNDDFRKKAHLKSIEEYQQAYEQSITDPETFWAEKAD